MTDTPFPSPDSHVRGRADRERSHRKTRDRSMVLTAIGVLLLMPPFAAMFVVEGTIAGFPIPVVYVFVVWIALIVGTARLARPLRRADEAGPALDSPDGES